MTNLEMYVLLCRLHNQAKEIYDMFDWEYIDNEGRQYVEKVKQRMEKERNDNKQN